MKQNIKLFFASLVSNNSAIDAARKKPWYAAIILFFISILLAAIPATVLQLKVKGNTYFETTTFSATEAVTDFSRELQKEQYNDKWVILTVGKEKILSADPGTFVAKENYKFEYCLKENYDVRKGLLLSEETKSSFFLFTTDTAYICILDPNDSSKTPLVQLECINAYKKLETNSLKAVFDSEDESKDLNDTMAYWKDLIAKMYNQTRLKNTGVQLLTLSIINVTISLIMGFMIWILTRGKNNPYRLFTIWESFKICFWAGISPSILTLGLGFLIKNFALYLFPLLLGVRIMWLTMKSLRPDGSGYAAQ